MTTFIQPEKCIFNLSDYVLSTRESLLLSLGLDFCLPVLRYPRKKVLLSLELFLYKIKNVPAFSHNAFTKVVNKSKALLNDLPRMVNKRFSHINEDDIRILKSLGKKKDIRIMKPDKGNGVVIMNTAEYLRKMMDILGDNSKFVECKDHEDIYLTNIRMEDKINYFLNKQKRLKVITEDEYRFLYVNGSSPSILYGLPKVHKPNVPLRPILAAFKTPSPIYHTRF